jgi:site-specific recombinase XerD
VDATTVRAYLLSLIDSGRSRSLVDQNVSALKFLYVELYERSPDSFRVPRPRREQKLPYVPTREEVLRMAEQLDNRKHRLAILLLYAAGLRVSELVRARVGDVNLDRLTFTVRDGKGRKDRQTILADVLRPELERVIQGRKRHAPLFLSARGGAWSKRSVQHVVSRAAERAGVEGRVTPHSLRHAFATHLLQGGTELRFIQGLLGHRNVTTTTRYTRMGDPGSYGIRSPL